MMKTIIQGGFDKNMVYNVEPVENHLNDWDQKRGYYEDCNVNYFNDEGLETDESYSFSKCSLLMLSISI